MGIRLHVNILDSLNRTVSTLRIFILFFVLFLSFSVYSASSPSNSNSSLNSSSTPNLSSTSTVRPWPSHDFLQSVISNSSYNSTAESVHNKNSNLTNHQHAKDEPIPSSNSNLTTVSPPSSTETIPSSSIIPTVQTLAQTRNSTSSQNQTLEASFASGSSEEEKKLERLPLENRSGGGTTRSKNTELIVAPQSSSNDDDLEPRRWLSISPSRSTTRKPPFNRYSSEFGSLVPTTVRTRSELPFRVSKIKKGSSLALSGDSQLLSPKFYAKLTGFENYDKKGQLHSASQTHFLGQNPDLKLGGVNIKIKVNGKDRRGNLTRWQQDYFGGRRPPGKNKFKQSLHPDHEYVSDDDLKWWEEEEADHFEELAPTRAPNFTRLSWPYNSHGDHHVLKGDSNGKIKYGPHKQIQGHGQGQTPGQGQEEGQSQSQLFLPSRRPSNYEKITQFPIITSSSILGFPKITTSTTTTTSTLDLAHDGGIFPIIIANPTPRPTQIPTPLFTPRPINIITNQISSVHWGSSGSKVPNTNTNANSNLNPNSGSNQNPDPNLNPTIVPILKPTALPISQNSHLIPVRLASAPPIHNSVTTTIKLTSNGHGVTTSTSTSTESSITALVPPAYFSSNNSDIYSFNTEGLGQVQNSGAAAISGHKIGPGPGVSGNKIPTTIWYKPVINHNYVGGSPTSTVATMTFQGQKGSDGSGPGSEGPIFPDSPVDRDRNPNSAPNPDPDPDPVPGPEEGEEIETELGSAMSTSYSTLPSPLTSSGSKLRPPAYMEQILNWSDKDGGDTSRRPNSGQKVAKPINSRQPTLTPNPQKLPQPGNDEDEDIRVLFKLWDFSNGSLRLNNQREIPRWILDGYESEIEREKNKNVILNYRDLPTNLRKIAHHDIIHEGQDYQDDYYDDHDDQDGDPDPDHDLDDEDDEDDDDEVSSKSRGGVVLNEGKEKEGRQHGPQHWQQLPVYQAGQSPSTTATTFAFKRKPPPTTEKRPLSLNYILWDSLKSGNSDSEKNKEPHDFLLEKEPDPSQAHLQNYLHYLMRPDPAIQDSTWSKVEEYLKQQQSQAPYSPIIDFNKDEVPPPPPEFPWKKFEEQDISNVVAVSLILSHLNKNLGNHPHNSLKNLNLGTKWHPTERPSPSSASPSSSSVLFGLQSNPLPQVHSHSHGDNNMNIPSGSSYPQTPLSTPSSLTTNYRDSLDGFTPPQKDPTWDAIRPVLQHMIYNQNFSFLLPTPFPPPSTPITFTTDRPQNQNQNQNMNNFNTQNGHLFPPNFDLNTAASASAPASAPNTGSGYQILQNSYPSTTRSPKRRPKQKLNYQGHVGLPTTSRPTRTRPRTTRRPRVKSTTTPEYQEGEYDDSDVQDDTTGPHGTAILDNDDSSDDYTKTLLTHIAKKKLKKKFKKKKKKGYYENFGFNFDVGLDLVELLKKKVLLLLSLKYAPLAVLLAAMLGPTLMLCFPWLYDSMRSRFKGGGKGKGKKGNYYDDHYDDHHHHEDDYHHDDHDPYNPQIYPYRHAYPVHDQDYDDHYYGAGSATTGFKTGVTGLGATGIGSATGGGASLLGHPGQLLVGVTPSVTTGLRNPFGGSRSKKKGNIEIHHHFHGDAAPSLPTLTATTYPTSILSQLQSGTGIGTGGGRLTGHSISPAILMTGGGQFHDRGHNYDPELDYPDSEYRGNSAHSVFIDPLPTSPMPPTGTAPGGGNINNYYYDDNNDNNNNNPYVQSGPDHQNQDPNQPPRPIILNNDADNYMKRIRQIGRNLGKLIGSKITESSNSGTMAMIFDSKKDAINQLLEKWKLMSSDNNPFAPQLRDDSDEDEGSIFRRGRKFPAFRKRKRRNVWLF